VRSSPLRTDVRPFDALDVGSGPAVVLLHGQPGDRRDWYRVVRAVDGRCRILAPDRHGYGLTGGRAGGFADNAAGVIELLDRSRVERAVVAGYSWGGGVALEVALSYPDRVAAVVLVSAIGGPGSVDRLDRVLTVPVLGDGLSLAAFAALQLEPLRRRLLGRHAKSDEALDVPTPDGIVVAWRSFMVEQRALVAELPSVTERLAAVTAPTVVIVGEADRVVRPASQLTMASQVGAEVIRVPHRGHLLLRDEPDAVARAILRTGQGLQ
jgi:pimeloyl-ACP methyl ester carboxylesterase